MNAFLLIFNRPRPAIVFWCGCALLAFCERSVAEEPLAWEEVRQLARAHSAGMASAQLSKQASHSAVNAAYGNFLPKVALNANRTRTKAELAGIESNSASLNYGATASLNLFNGFSSLASLSRAKATELAADASLQLTSATLRHDLRVAFFNIYLQQERLQLNEKDLKRVRQNQKLMELKYNSGNEARWNLKTTKADTESALYNVANSKALLNINRETLASLLQMEALPDRAVTVAEKSILQPPLSPPANALQLHPQLLKSHFAINQSEQDIRLARAGFYPSLDLSLSRSHSENAPDPGITAKTNSNTFAITASWNIFNGASDYFNVQQANLNSEAAELANTSLERRLTADLRTKSASFQLSLAQLPVTRSVREAAEERERTVSEQYRSGLKTYLDWEQAESQLLDSEQKELKALGDSLTAFADYEQALGLTLEQP